MQRFRKRFEAAFPELRANSTVYTCYTGLALLIQALKERTGDIGRASLHQSLLKVKAVSMPDGTLAVAEREIQYELGGFMIHDGVPVPFDPLGVNVSDAQNMQKQLEQEVKASGMRSLVYDVG